jgi:hypothetical protein
MVENYWRPSFILRLILFWLTILFVIGWLPMLRGAFDGPTYEWGNSYFGKQFSGKGTAGDYWFLIVQAALGILILFLGWRGARPVFLVLALVYQSIGLADSIQSSIANPEQYRFQGDTLGVDVNLTWIAPILNAFFLFLTILWAVRNAKIDWQKPVAPWSSRNTKWLLGLLALLPVQYYLLHYGSQPSTEDKIGVLITIFQWLMIGNAFSAKPAKNRDD